MQKEKADKDFGDRLPNDFCDWCGDPIVVQIMRNSGACSTLHQEYEYWEEIFGETIP